MINIGLIAPREAELNRLVSIAIRRAELLDDAGLSAAKQAWLEVMECEERLAAITDPADVPGGVARAGAVWAALAAGQRAEAVRLAAQYLAEASLPPERRETIERAFEEDRQRRAEYFPTLVRIGRLTDVDRFRAVESTNAHVFPLAA